ncbi:hypothetical protein P389DRAFT_166543 [Cystobasidium minutum MCA 4210]|uniref:uncharacterized protein n=1 Tax=Cystobasidium minutum MCA 4210 TaxID=1397322 RepID=UPI0034CFE6DF|eukprot:jgi/Rhomi1/166543/fgenesh1_kg.2_\
MVVSLGNCWLQVFSSLFFHLSPGAMPGLAGTPGWLTWMRGAPIGFAGSMLGKTV